MLVVIAKKEDLQTINELVKEIGLEVGCYNTITQLVISGTRVKTKKLHK